MRRNISLMKLLTSMWSDWEMDPKIKNSFNLLLIFQPITGQVYSCAEMVETWGEIHISLMKHCRFRKSKKLTQCSGITYLQVIWLGNGSKNEAQLHTIVEELAAEFTLGSTMGPSEFHWCPCPKLLLTLLILLLFGSCKKGFCWIWSWRWVGGGTEETGARVGTPLVP